MIQNDIACFQNHLLEVDAKKAAGPTWETVRYMVSEIQYGGRITDDFDQLLMDTYAEKYFHQEVTRPNFELYKDERAGISYKIPDSGEIEGFRKVTEASTIMTPIQYVMAVSRVMQIIFSQVGLNISMYTPHSSSVCLDLPCLIDLQANTIWLYAMCATAVRTAASLTMLCLTLSELCRPLRSCQVRRARRSLGCTPMLT